MDPITGESSRRSPAAPPVGKLHALKYQEDHAATPRKDSWLTERGGTPANLLADEDYPIIAECFFCAKRIRLLYKFQMEWAHVARGDAGSAS